MRMFHLPFNLTCIHPSTSCMGKMSTGYTSCSSVACSYGHMITDTKGCTCPRITAFFAIALVCVLIYIFLEPELEELQDALVSIDAPTSCLIILVLFTVTSFPITWGYIMVNVSAGYRFGLCLGYLLTVVCVACGSLVAFLICRFLCGHWLTPRLQADYLRSIMAVVEGDGGFWVIALTRLTPIPFGLQNGLFAMSKVPASTFLAASSMGLLPTQALNAYIGASLRSAKDLSNQPSYSNSILVFQLVISIFLSMYIIRIAQRRLQSKLEHQGMDGQELGLSSLPTIDKVVPPETGEMHNSIPNGLIPEAPSIVREANEVKIHMPS